MFDYASGNQFNRYTFYKCTKITSLSGSSYPIFNTDNTLWYSPTVNGNTIIENGLFSPLTGLTRISRFSGTPYLSRYVFRRDGNKTYPITSINWQSIGLIYDDIDNYEVESNVPSLYNTSNLTITSGEESKLGNMTDFFYSLPNLQSITNTFNVPVINYDTLTIPTTVTQIYGSFNNSYGFGTFNWKHTFNGTYTGLTTITNAFNLNNYLNNPVEF